MNVFLNNFDGSTTTSYFEQEEYFTSMIKTKICIWAYHYMFLFIYNMILLDFFAINNKSIVYKLFFSR